ncbi:MAG: hypothetical protein KGL43_04495 [Burkholderiales bacterium]|nr:hypothetical protein [Burkholderiales bacterium]MDE2398388.1 hypothetical protein [Burkholderiales bacterium]MDE2452831.1 hypothetical protein [Burkholderiales bacterium]
MPALAAWNVREPCCVHLNDLGNRNAAPVDKKVYDGMRGQLMAGTLVPRSA